jgi:hypothetical protein
MKMPSQITMGLVPPVSYTPIARVSDNSAHTSIGADDKRYERASQPVHHTAKQVGNSENYRDCNYAKPIRKKRIDGVDTFLIYSKVEAMA